MLARRRLRAITPHRYAQLAAASALSLYLIVITGAAVRLTGSGLACESWPGCQEGAFFPAVGTHSAIEFGNRAFALFPIVLSLAAWIAAYRVPGLSRWGVWVAALVFLGTIGQAPLGLLTIRLDLHPLMVLTHFLLALVVLAGAVVLAVESWGNASGRAASPLSRSLRWLSLVLVVACGILVVTGTLSTASGPHPGDSADIDRFWNLLDAMWLHVRATAAFGISFLVLLVYLARARASRRPAPPRRARAPRDPGAPDGGRRDPVAQRAAVVARARACRHGRRGVGLDGRPRDRALAAAGAPARLAELD